MKTICLLFALRQEAEPLLQSGGWKEESSSFHPSLPCTFFSKINPQHSIRLIVVIHGKDSQSNQPLIGSQMASLVAFLCIHNLNPWCLINCGLAGGFSSLGASISDSYFCSPFFYYHHRSTDFFQNCFPAHPIASHLAQQLTMQMSSFSSSDSIQMTSEDFQFFKCNQIVVKDMESASIAWICHLHQVPYFSIKVISDLFDQPESLQNCFSYQLKRVSPILKEKTLNLITLLSSKNFSFNTH